MFLWCFSGISHAIALHGIRNVNDKIDGNLFLAKIRTNRQEKETAGQLLNRKADIFQLNESIRIVNWH